MEAAQYIRLFRRWWWLITTAAFIGGGMSFIIHVSQPAIYETHATISIGRFIEARNPDQADIRVGIELAQTYAQLLRTTTVLQSTIDQLNLSMSTDGLLDLIDTRILQGTSLLVIEVRYTDAILTADIANTLAQQLILQSPSNLTRDQQAQIDFASSQIEALTAQIEDARLELELIGAQLNNAQTAASQQSLVEQRNALINQINGASATVAQFTDTISTLQQNTNALNVVEQARIPTQPRQASQLLMTLLGAIVGAGLAAAGIFAYEYLDETIRTTEEAAQTLAVPVLGAIFRIGKKNDSYRDRLITNLPPGSPIAEGYRTIRTNLLFGINQEDISVYTISSPGPSEGKSVTTANLAISMAMAGLQVLLIDGDLRKPKVHEIFELDNSIGLTTLLSAEPHDNQRNGRGANYLPTNLIDCIQTTPLSNLWVITSGILPSNPTELLGSARFRGWMEIMRTSLKIDVVLIDSPPTLMVTDSNVMAATASAGVILVVDCGNTRRGAALRAKEQCQQLGIALKGVVVNRVNPRDQNYGYSYGYYYTSQVPSQNGKEIDKMVNNHRQ